MRAGCLPFGAASGCLSLLSAPHVPARQPVPRALPWARVARALNCCPSSLLVLPVIPLLSPSHSQICVFMGPLFSGLCALATFFFMREVRGDGAGLASAAFIAIIPSYISRSVAGSYDLESIAIAALVTVFFLYVKVGRWAGNSRLLRAALHDGGGTVPVQQCALARRCGGRAGRPPPGHALGHAMAG